MKIKHWIILFTGLIILSLGAYYYTSTLSHTSKAAVIYQNGEVIREIDLNTVAVPYSIDLDGEDGAYNRIYVENGQISIAEASCPDQICVAHKPISDGVEPIVCLPNRVTVQIKSAEGDIADGFGGG